MGLGENMLLPMGEKSAPPTIGDITLGDMNSAHSITTLMTSHYLAYNTLTDSTARQTASTNGKHYRSTWPLSILNRLQGQARDEFEYLEDGGAEMGLQIVSAAVAVHRALQAMA